jgi:hypothetical protein
VASTTGLTAGSYVNLTMNDSPDGSLGKFLHNNQYQASFCNGRLTYLEWVVQIKSINGNTLELAQPLRFDVRTTWNPQIHVYQAVQEVGVENLRIEFPNVPYPGHLSELGYQGMTFYNAVNSWVKNVEVRNADSGFNLGSGAKNITLSNVQLTVDNPGRIAHHGFQFGESDDNLLTDFTTPKFIHDVTVNRMAMGNVIRRGQGNNMNFDHHRQIPYENLFTDINVGAGSELYASSGDGCNGPNSGARETFWGIHSSSWTQAPVPPDFPQDIVVSANRSQQTDAHWWEQVDNLTPVDLYLSQLSRRLSTLPTPTPTPTPTSTPTPTPTLTPTPTPVTGRFVWIMIVLINRMSISSK